jgi:GYF domain 2
MLGGEQSMRWYVNQNGKTEGPFSEERIAMLVTWGKISRDAYICDEQFSTWVSIMRTGFGPLIAEALGTENPTVDAAPEHGAEVTTDAEQTWQRLRAWVAGVVLLAGALMLAMSAT